MTELTFQPEQLKSARRLRALSLRELSELLEGNGFELSKQAISKYENAIAQPSTDTLAELAKALKVSTSYFFETETIQLNKIEFRKLDNYSVRETERIVEVVKIELAKYLELESILGIESVFTPPEIDNRISNLNQIDDYAEELRTKWQLGLSPIPNVIEMLEDNNIKLIQIRSSVELDGFSTFANDDFPVIVLNRDKLDEKQDRKRWTALHELGHILLDFVDLPQKEVERYCHYFAGAMLFPKRNFLKEIGEQRTKLSLHELASFKQEYGVSMQAIVYRAKELGVISQNYYRQFFFMLDQLGYKVNEPVAYYGKKASSRFDKLLFRALSEEIIDIEKAAELKDMSVEEFRREYPII
ncbi:XRE family transcriptional regulator [Cryomorphaceae bacterium 1068]|nr:XRE family transcriptional regulator [Cryomorphaceae bacterium 1068]